MIGSPDRVRGERIAEKRQQSAFWFRVKLRCRRCLQMEAPLLGSRPGMVFVRVNQVLVASLGATIASLTGCFRVPIEHVRWGLSVPAMVQVFRGDCYVLSKSDS